MTRSTLSAFACKVGAANVAASATEAAITLRLVQRNILNLLWVYRPLLQASIFSLR